MRRFALSWLLTLISYLCCAQATTINQDKGGHIYLFDADTRTYTSLDTIRTAKLVGIRSGRENSIVAVFGNDVDTFTKEYFIHNRVNPSRSTFHFESENGKVKNYSFTNSGIAIDASSAGLIIYENGTEIGRYISNYTGPWPAYLENVPLDIDDNLKTLLIEERVSPSTLLSGGYTTSILEISIRDGYILWDHRKSGSAVYSYDRNYILFTSSKGRIYYLDRKSKKIHKEPRSIVAYWL